MNKLAITDTFCDLAYGIPLALALGTEWVTWYCSTKTLHREPLQIKKLLTAGIEVVMDTPLKSGEHEYMFVDIWHRGRGRGFDFPIKSVYYTHDTGHCPATPKVGEFMLYSSERQFLDSMGAASYLLDDHGSPDWGLAPQGGEGVLAGLLHLGEWSARRHEEKAALRKELAEKLGVDFDPALPLVTYYTSENNDGRDMDIGLHRLDGRANVVIKHNPQSLRSDAAGKNIHMCAEPTAGSFLLRFAADYILAAYASGVFTTSIMLGLRVIPVYTQRIDSFGKGGRGDLVIEEKQRWHSYTTIFQRKKSMHADICEHITPLHILDTDSIFARMHDADYWKRYDEGIASVQRKIFGRCYVDDGPRRAAHYIKNLLRHGTFLTPEISALDNEVQGSLKNVVPCSVLL